MSDDANHPPGDDRDHPPHFVREWRDYMGWTQEDLAGMVHVSQSKITRIESGERGLKTNFLKDLARVFRVPPSALLEVNPSTEEGAQTAALLLAWHRLTKSQRSDVVRMVQALAPPNDKANAS